MKTLAFISRALLLLIVFTIFLTCDILPDRDECDGTIAHEKIVNIKATVHCRDILNLPLKEKWIKLTFSKTPCGEPSKGQIFFEGLTDSQGNFSTTEANYSLRNLKDEIEIDVFSPDLGNTSDKDNSDIRVFSYNDFIEETIKIADITMIRKW